MQRRAGARMDGQLVRRTKQMHLDVLFALAGPLAVPQAVPQAVPRAVPQAVPRRGDEGCLVRRHIKGKARQSHGFQFCHKPCAGPMQIRTDLVEDGAVRALHGFCAGDPAKMKANSTHAPSPYVLVQPLGKPPWRPPGGPQAAPRQSQRQQAHKGQGAPESWVSILSQTRRGTHAEPQ